MKKMILSAILFTMNILNVNAADVNYTCIANTLQATNSDIYYNLSDAEIDAMLTIPEMLGHIDAINAAKRCEIKSPTQLACNGNLEAQFIGKISNVNYSAPEAGNLEHTTYGIGSFSLYNENSLCPLDLGIALDARFWVQGHVDLKNGDFISGVLIYNPKTQMFIIE